MPAGSPSASPPAPAARRWRHRSGGAPRSPPRERTRRGSGGAGGTGMCPGGEEPPRPALRPGQPRADARPCPLPSAAAFNLLLPRIAAADCPLGGAARGRRGGGAAARVPAAASPRTKQRERAPRHGRPRPPATAVPPSPPPHWPGAPRAYAFRLSIGGAD